MFSFEILKQFSAKVDLIGASFGVMGTESSEFQQNLLDKGNGLEAILAKRGDYWNG